ncbi:MAG: hypothetical protein HY719_08460, partial [Planctomycetes bacterium]|nr:hypothetical protein [Planctomycetota bacterium]
MTAFTRLANVLTERARRFAAPGFGGRRVGVPALAGAAIVALLIAAAAPASLAAEPPAEVSIQGVLTDAAGAPVNGSHDFRVRLYTVPTGGVAVFEETHFAAQSQAISINSGLYVLPLGQGTPVTGTLVDSLANNTTLYLGITVDADSEMTPRTKLTASSSALNASLLDGLDSTAFLRASGAPVFSAGTLTLDASSVLDIAGTWRIAGVPVTASAADLNSITGGLSASNITVGTLADARLSPNVTLAGTIFNTANNLVKLDGGGALPAVSGANLTGLNFLPLSGGTLTGTVAFSGAQLFSGNG